MLSCLLWVWNLLVAPGKYEHVPIGVHGHGRADQPQAFLTKHHLEIIQTEENPWAPIAVLHNSLPFDECCFMFQTRTSYH